MCIWFFVVGKYSECFWVVEPETGVFNSEVRKGSRDRPESSQPGPVYEFRPEHLKRAKNHDTDPSWPNQSQSQGTLRFGDWFLWWETMLEAWPAIACLDCDWFLWWEVQPQVEPEKACFVWDWFFVVISKARGRACDSLLCDWFLWWVWLVFVTGNVWNLNRSMELKRLT